MVIVLTGGLHSMSSRAVLLFLLHGPLQSRDSVEYLPCVHQELHLPQMCLWYRPCPQGLCSLDGVGGL